MSGALQRHIRSEVSLKLKIPMSVDVDQALRCEIRLH
jgi:hypothetical protein